MRIGEISQLTGFSPDTLRWYERQGLISSKRNTQGLNNYRIYNSETLAQLQAIKQMKSLGFTLREIKELFILEEIGELHCESVEVLVNERLRQLGEKIHLLTSMQAKLILVKEACTGNCKEAFSRIT